MYPRFFDPAAIGESLKEVATDVIQAGHHKVVSRWFHSSKDADLFIWLDTQQNILKQQLSFYGQVVEWNVIEGVKTGMVVEDESHPQRQSSDVVRFDPDVQKAQLEQALLLLNHITALSQRERDELAQNFTRAPKGKTVHPEEFVRQFGAFLGPNAPSAKPVPVRTGWLHRLKSWFKR